MPASRPFEVFLGLPPGHAHSGLRAALMAMNVIPQPLPPAGAQRHALLRTLEHDTRRAAFIDISQRRSSLVELDHAQPRGPSRARLFLTRLGGGHVSEPEQRWAATLGFAGLWPELGVDASSSGPAGLNDCLERIAAAMGTQAPSLAQVKRLSGSTRGRMDHPARERIRRATGDSAEAVAALLAQRLRIRDRQYHLQNYRACFVGRSAVRAIESTFRCTADGALEVGRALHELGLLVHVTHDHDFEDADYFYRLAVSRRADKVALDEALRVLLDNIDIRDRSWHARAYPRCWIGAEAVELFVGRFDLERHQARIVLHRLMQSGAFDHVAAQRPFIDGHFFYRFTPVLDKAPAPASAPASASASASAPSDHAVALDRAPLLPSW